ncbi:MAG: acyl-CoA thioesterase [Acholeplasmatales bacterium]|nr:acyl-CoA thioesterase [Acholeplasmatales bacterium]
MMSYTHKIQYYETDKMGVTHHSNYIRFMEEARLYFMASNGFDYSKIEEIGIISPVIGVECEYKNTSTYPDILNIDAQVIEYNGFKLKIQYVMTNQDGKLVAIGTSKHCFLSKDGKILSLKKAMPDLDNKLKELCVKN